MSESNTLNFTNPSVFILLGIPGLEMAHVWISIPFCIMYILALSGNFTILFIVKKELSLHVPMYYFLCMLALTDLVLSMSIQPKLLSIFCFNSKEIDFGACFTQMFFFHCFLVVESGIFVAMAVDRYVAICHPLRHATILTNPMVSTFCLVVVLRGVFITLPMVLLARQWSYCRTNIAHPYCAHMPVVGLACGDTRISSHYGLLVLFCVKGLDMIFIGVTYTQILRAIFRLPTKDARLKTFSTCGSHLCSILVYYIPALFFSLMSRFNPNGPHHFHTIINHMYNLMPPMLNPIIYGVRTKQIRDRLLHLFVRNSPSLLLPKKKSLQPHLFSQGPTSNPTEHLKTLPPS